MNAHTKQQQDKVFQTDFIDSQKSDPPFAHLLALKKKKYIYREREIKKTKNNNRQTEIHHMKKKKPEALNIIILNCVCLFFKQHHEFKFQLKGQVLVY